MSNISSPRKHNFDPSNYNAPVVKPKNGEYQLTDYQAALTARSWMHKNMPGGMIDAGFIQQVRDQGNTPGPITVDVDGKKLTLTEQEKAAFLKFHENGNTLFRRLDGGENGTHDFLMGEWDIDAAIKNGRLHGAAQHSKEGYWRNRNSEMSTDEASRVLNDYFTEKFGSNWTINQQDLKTLANAHGMHVPTENGKEFVMIDDPAVIRAAGLLLDKWGEVQIGEANSIGFLSKEELQKLSTL